MTLPSRRTRFARSLVGVLVVLVVSVGACVPTGERPELVDDHLDDDIAGVADCPAPDGPFAEFRAAEIGVLGADGSEVRRCVLVAVTADQRARGLMEVTDLAGYDGMLFAFEDDTEGSFWMGNTYLPLTIAFVASDGEVVSHIDMEPCPDAVDCATYPPAGPYRWALEVPQGTLGEFGLHDGARLDPDTLPVPAMAGEVGMGAGTGR